MTTAFTDAPITEFSGAHAFLSNFAALPMLLPFGPEMVYWPTAEHAFQAMKCTDALQAEWIHDAPTPREAKRRGQTVELRPDWDQTRRMWMLFVVQAKFQTVPGLMLRLAETRGRLLVEGNTWGDDYWGAVTGDELLQRKQPVPQLPVWYGDGEPLLGHNWLGRILMMIRELA